MNKKETSKYWVIGVIVGILLLVGVVAFAQSVKVGSVVIENVENLVMNVSQTAEDMAGDIFGSAGEDDTRDMTRGTQFSYGIYVPFGEYVEVDGTLDIDGIIDVDATAISWGNSTTTPSPYTYSGCDITLTQVATTSAANPAPMGYFCNTGSALLVDDWYIDIQTANDLWAGNWTVGTTTCITAGSTCGNGTSSFTATATASLLPSQAIATSTIGWYAVDDNIAVPALGTYYDEASSATTSPWVLNSGDCIVIHNNQSGATSTYSYGTTADDGSVSTFVDFVGAFHADCVAR